jgi:cytochrome c
MRVVRIYCSVLGALVGVLSVQSQSAQLNGGDVFGAKCAPCHTLDLSTKKMGPPLCNLIGRRVGSVVGFRYSTDLAGSERVWTMEMLTRFLREPREIFPGTSMPMDGVSDTEAKALSLLISGCRGL